MEIVQVHYYSFSNPVLLSKLCQNNTASQLQDFEVSVMTPEGAQTLYFGYGSNLWLQQMARRCPTSTYKGIARLPSYRWMINSRGYANIVEASLRADDASLATNTQDDVTYGLVYSLQPDDEEGLDINEGVPYAYTKEYLEVDFWPSNDTNKAVDLSRPALKKKVLVYIDRKRVTDDGPNEEYIYRMNMGIEDAVRLGVPLIYVDGVMRKFIPVEQEEGAN